MGRIREGPRERGWWREGERRGGDGGGRWSMEAGESAATDFIRRNRTHSSDIILPVVLRLWRLMIGRVETRSHQKPRQKFCAPECRRSEIVKFREIYVKIIVIRRDIYDGNYPIISILTAAIAHSVSFSLNSLRLSYLLTREKILCKISISSYFL